jgi:hypothetical protein
MQKYLAKLPAGLREYVATLTVEPQITWRSLMPESDRMGHIQDVLADVTVELEIVFPQMMWLQDHVVINEVKHVLPISFHFNYSDTVESRCGWIDQTCDSLRNMLKKEDGSMKLGQYTRLALEQKMGTIQLCTGDGEESSIQLGKEVFTLVVDRLIDYLGDWKQRIVNYNV